MIAAGVWAFVRVVRLYLRPAPLECALIGWAQVEVDGPEPYTIRSVWNLVRVRIVYRLSLRDGC